MINLIMASSDQNPAQGDSSNIPEDLKKFVESCEKEFADRYTSKVHFLLPYNQDQELYKIIVLF